MRQIVIPHYGQPDVLEVRDVRNTEPGPGEVRIRVKAIGINFADLLARMGVYPGAPRPPFVPGYEVSGTIDAVGIGVEHFKTNDAVFALTYFGGYSETVIVPTSKVFKLPTNMKMEEAAAFPCNFLTAYHVMIALGNLRPGQRVLIHSAGSGLGIAAIQIAKIVGAHTWGTASIRKHEALCELGLDHVIDYEQEDYETVVRQHTAGKGVHLILDPWGGRNWRKGYRLLAPTGRLCFLGFSEISRGRKMPSLRRLFSGLASLPFWHPLRLIEDNRGVFGVKMAALWDDDELLAQEISVLLKYQATGSLRPVIDCTFPFTEVAAAHTYIHEGKNVGKVLLITG